MFGATFVGSSSSDGYVNVLGGHGQGGTVAAGATNWIVPFINGLDVIGRSTPWPGNGTHKNLSVRLAGAQPASGSLIVTVLEAGVGTAVTITIPAGSPSGTYQSSVLLSAPHINGNLVSVSIQNNAAAASAVIGGVTWQISTP
jgi:hypothetical protein